ncbi:MAG: hypothetical protein ABF615_10450 [Gluconobacter oxydans]
MTPSEIASLRKAHQEFKNLKLPSKRPMDDRDLQGLFHREGLVEASINLRLEAAYGFTRAGMLALSQLAADVRSRSGLGARSVSRQSLAKALAQLAIASWGERPNGPLTDREFDEFDEKISKWFASLDIVRTHYIPCTVNAWPTEAFAIGPVRFYPFNEFPVEDLGLMREDVWPAGEGAMSSLAEINLGGLLRIAQMRNAWTVAEVAVPGREKTQSELTADIAVDVALAIVQLLTPPRMFDRASRATSRAAPVWWARLSVTEGTVSPGSQNDEPGRVFGQGALERELAQFDSALGSMGNRLQSYIDGSGILPALDETWCNAAYWYHEAVAEPLDTVAIAKFETAIEVLFRSESSSGSKKRLLQGLEAFFGKKKGDDVGGITADELATSIVTSRSRVLHGTWPTLHSELPDSKGGVAVGSATAERLARFLLIAFSEAVDAYGAACAGDDTVEALLDWKLQQLTPPLGSPSA